MAQLNISEAARVSGKSRSTINRYIKSGKISVSKDATGCTTIDTAELLRVFGPLQGNDGSRLTHDTDVTQVACDTVRHDFEYMLELLREQLRASREREERLLNMLEQEQVARRELEQRLLPPGREEQLPIPESSKSGRSPSAIGKSLLAKFFAK